MTDLSEYLKQHKYIQIKFKISKTNHLTINTKINGIKGDFILDTGASNSCVNYEDYDYFNLKIEDSNTKASGAGANDLKTHQSKNNHLKLGKWEWKKFDLIILDLNHVNIALEEYKSKTIHGIIGADVLLKGNAIIDYANKYLYLKK